MAKMNYRLALDLGSTSLGWAMIRLDKHGDPCAVIRAGVRIFPDGRNPKDKTSLAATRRAARAARRRRDRYLRRRQRMLAALTEFGFFPTDKAEQKKLELLSPYPLRAKGLDEALTPYEFGRVVFHLNQRRGFKSNRKTDRGDKESGALKGAISESRRRLADENCRTIGEWLNKRMLRGETVRARLREARIAREDGRSKIDRRYDLYVDRAMIAAEFDALWAKQAALDPQRWTEPARHKLRDILLYQRNLRPVLPGRCTLLPDEPRAPLALPSAQRFRILQEVNNLRRLDDYLMETPLTRAQRDQIVASLETKGKFTFTAMKKLIGMGGRESFNVEDVKREDLKGNATSAALARPEFFGKAWHEFDLARQDEIVLRLLTEENEDTLIQWLVINTGVNEERAAAIANVNLPDGYTSLSHEALKRIVPELEREVCTFAHAVTAAGFEHHSDFAPDQVLPALPYYAEVLQRYVAFGSGIPEDPPEKRYGRIANPTEHIGLNQVRTVVNALIKRYGHPTEVIVEVARDLKQSKDQRDLEAKRQAENQKRNNLIRADIARARNVAEHLVSRFDIEKVILWKELSPNEADRRCPYSGEQISFRMLLSEEVEVDHILPYARTLDDSLNNKVVALRHANRLKTNLTPWEAFGKKSEHGFNYESILQRAEAMPRAKRYRFAEDGMQRWLDTDKDFIARALNDTRYLSRVAREYLAHICAEKHVRVIPGRMTALLRAKFALNDILGLRGEKNRNDHRHHAVDACVIGVTDQRMLQRFAEAASDARARRLDRLVEKMPLPWPTYRDHVARAINQIWVSYKPDHGYEGAMHNDTAYGLRDNGVVSYHKVVDGRRTRFEENLSVIGMSSQKAVERHGRLPDGQPKPYKGYKGDSNYCIEIVRAENGKWAGDIISTFQAYQAVKAHGGDVKVLTDQRRSLLGKPLVMRLRIGDCVRMEIKGQTTAFRVATISGNGQVFFAPLHEANVDARNRSKEDEFAYVSKYPGSMFTAKARLITVSPIGDLLDGGFKP